MERICVTCVKPFYRELDPTSRTQRRWKGHSGRAANGIHTFRFFGDETEQECDYLSKPRQVHYKNKCKISQRALQFWQTRSHATILHQSVPADWSEKVVSLREDKILYQRIPTPLSAPKITLKDAWQEDRARPKREFPLRLFPILRACFSPVCVCFPPMLACWIPMRRRLRWHFSIQQ